MTRVRIGVHVHAEPENLLATLAAVAEHTPEPHELVLLPDGPDAPTARTLSALGHIPQSGTADPLGAPACFNRLTQSGSEPVVVLLESGCLVGPGWLGFLLNALGDDPRNGLAGPSTNRSWNEQGAFPAAGRSRAEIARTAAVAGRTRTQCVPLTPLHSLADFCYAVRREVIETVGLADECYGLGPCWEMDYNIRAARAGFRGVWAAAAYVYRVPPTARRQREENRLFDASKRRYQDKFCGLRLRGQKSDYRSHCRGDDCPNFAPAELISLNRATSETSPLAAIPRVAVGEPLVSCIMPTRERRGVVPLAVRGFLAQDYPNRELVVVDDGPDPVADLMPADPRVRYLRLDGTRTVGAKRNVACAAAQGEFIAHWDDDDFYSTRRLRSQVAVLASGADVCGSSRVHYYDPAADRAWLYSYTGGRGGWVAGMTLAYRKSLWKRNPFPEIQVGEDTRFLWSGAAKKVHDAVDPELWVAMIHGRNVSPKSTTGPWWTERPTDHIRRLLGGAIGEYRAALAGSSNSPAVRISCIMPTRNRRAFVPLALRCFAEQDYPERELVIVDDGSDSVSDLVAGIPGVKYVPTRGTRSIGAKRNIACEVATGAIIAHWDDDDWYAPQRLSRQVAPILAGQADVTGLEGKYFLELPELVVWTPSGELHRRLFEGDVHGGTLTYSRKHLAGLRYPDVNLAEDAALLRQLRARGARLARVPNGGCFVYTRHGHNAWAFATGRFLDPSAWNLGTLPDAMTASIATQYAAAAKQLGQASSVRVRERAARC